MIFRLWSATNAAGLPLRNATATWHQLCDCGHLDNLKSDTRGPVGMVVDSEDGVPSDVLELAAKATHRCKLAAKPEPATPASAPRKHERTKRPTTRTRPENHEWTPERDAVVTDHGCLEAAAILGIPAAAVSRRRQKLGIRNTPREWTEEQDLIVTTRKLWRAAEELGLPRAAIEWRRRQLKLSGQYVGETRTGRKSWTPDADATILAMRTAEAARRLGRAPSSIRTRKAWLTARMVAA